MKIYVAGTHYLGVAPIMHVMHVRNMRKKNGIICNKEIPSTINYFVSLPYILFNIIFCCFFYHKENH